MPQCVFRYHKGKLSVDEVARIGLSVRPLIAEAASTQVRFTMEDVEWIPEPYNDGASGVPEVAIEVRTLGFRDRKNKLDKAGALALREKITAVPGFPYVSPETLLLWIQWQDFDGAHV